MLKYNWFQQYNDNLDQLKSKEKIQTLEPKCTDMGKNYAYISVDSLLGLPD